MLRINICILAVLGALLASANGQDCGKNTLLMIFYKLYKKSYISVPMSVTDITLTFTGRLSWRIREEETCEITHFMVHMSEPDQDARFIMKAFTTTLNVDYIKACELWHFNIVPHHNEVVGDGHLFISKMPVPMGKLSIMKFGISKQDKTKYLLKQWSKNSKYKTDSVVLKSL